MNIPADISKALNTISDSNTYIYGKAVREILMHNSPKRCRFVTPLPISLIKRMFPGSNIRGKYRSNVHGCEFVFISTLSDISDICSVQDFTVNSAAYSDITGLYDKYGAENDIREKKIRFLNNDDSCIYENPLIMLKAVRMCAELEFTLDTLTENIIRRNAARILGEHPHKVAGELDRILMTQHPEYIKMLHELGILKYVIPQLERCFGEPQKNKYHIYDVGDHIIHAVMNTPRDYTLRWAALLHDVGKPCCSSTDNNGIIHFYGHHHESRLIADDILHRFGMDKDLMHEILILIENHDVRVDPTPTAVKKMMCRTGGELFEKLMTLQMADNMAKKPKYFPEKYRRINTAVKISKTILENKEPYCYSQLMVNSRDLQKYGIRTGRETNEIMRTLMDDVINNPSLNTREYLLKRAKQLKK